MLNYEVVISPNADADFDAIADYIAADSPIRSVSFVDQLRDRALKFLAAAPNGGSPIPPFRYAVFGNYVVAYSVDDEAARVRILLVSEGHRNWRRLLKDRT